MKFHRDIGTIMDPTTLVRSPGINKATTKERRIWIRNHGTTRIKSHGIRITSTTTTRSQNLRIHVLLLLKMLLDFYSIENDILYRSVMDNGHKFSAAVIPEDLTDTALF